ncbi:MAG: hypothetical protein ACI959_001469 [Limisphaerales bacterium]|jgi:hypothetical protein
MGKVSKNARVGKGKALGGGKDHVKVIVTEKSAKTGAYTFREVVVHKDNLKSTLAGNK